MQPETLQENSLMKPLAPAQSHPSSKTFSSRITLRPRRRRPGSRPPTGEPPSGSRRLPLPTGSTRPRDMPFPRLLPHSSSCFWDPGHWNPPRGPWAHFLTSEKPLPCLASSGARHCWHVYPRPEGAQGGCLQRCVEGSWMELAAGRSSGSALQLSACGSMGKGQHWGSCTVHPTNASAQPMGTLELCNPVELEQGTKFLCPCTDWLLAPDVTLGKAVSLSPNSPPKG